MSLCERKAVMKTTFVGLREVEAREARDRIENTQSPMDIMPWSRLFCKLIGIEWHQTTTRTLANRCCNLLLHSCFYAFAGIIVCLQVYSMMLHKTEVILNMSYVTYYIFKTLSWTWMFLRIQRMIVVIMWSAERLNKETIAKVNAYDRRHVITLAVFALSTIAAASGYFYVNGLRPELNAMALGYYEKGSVVPTYALVPC